MSRGGDEVFRLLVICTANQCRSPMAAAIAEQSLRNRGVDAAVASCGILGGGVAASPGAVRALARRGLDLSSHRSHQLDAVTLDAADLVITMERRHIASVAELSISAVSRTFTLRELSDLASVVGPRRPEVTVRRWIEEADAMRMPESVLTSSIDADIEDPMGGPNRAYRRCADQISGLIEVVVGALFPST